MNDDVLDELDPEERYFVLLEQGRVGSGITRHAPTTAIGASAARLVDIGIVNVLDLLDGPQTIYTPELNSYVQFLLAPFDFVALAAPDQTGRIDVVQGDFDPDGTLTSGPPAPYARIGEFEMSVGDTFADMRLNIDQSNPPAGAGAVLSSSLIRHSTPLAAWFLAGADGFPARTTPTAWQPGHAYAHYETIIGDDDHYWAATTAGTSGGSEPDFAGNEGATVDDGTVTWTDEGGIPTAGQVHLWAVVMPPPA